jgi:hypothetical protein
LGNVFISFVLQRIGTEVTPFLAEKDIPGFLLVVLCGFCCALKKDAKTGHSENLRNLASSIEGLEISPAPTASSSAGTGHANGGGGAPPPAAAANNSAAEQQIQNVMNVTGATRQQVIEALRACNGNADAAAQMLSGFNF